IRCSCGEARTPDHIIGRAERASCRIGTSRPARFVLFITRIRSMALQSAPARLRCCARAVRSVMLDAKRTLDHELALHLWFTLSKSGIAGCAVLRRTIANDD